MTDDLIHFASYWYPGPEFDIWAPRGIKLWAQILRKLHEDKAPIRERYTWFGKISLKDDTLGIPRREIPELNSVVQKQKKSDHTYLFMWTHDHSNNPASIHVGKVIEISPFRHEFLKDGKHVPINFYENIVRKYASKVPDPADLLPFWFKLSDIRKIDFDNYKNLYAYDIEEDKFTDFLPDSNNTLSPVKIKESNPKSWFDKEKLHKEGWQGWWEETLLYDDWDPGQFYSDKLKEIYSEALRYAQLNVPILILGERGVGKTFLAWWIRMQSPFKQGGRHKKFDWGNHGSVKKTVRNKSECIGKFRERWPQLACGGFIDENSLKSELFGHFKGSFTGADKDRQGLLHMLDGDTLFLDEIGDLPKSIERALIKAVEEKSYTPLGGSESFKSDFRLIAATNKTFDDLHRMIDPDFLDRISTVVLELPPLRHMPEDIPWLWSAVYHQTRVNVTQTQGESEHNLRHPSEKEHRLISSILQSRKDELLGNIRDLRKIAIRVIGTLRDPRKPELDPHTIIDSVLALNRHADSQLYRGSQVSLEIADAFSKNRGLDHVVQKYGPLDLKRVITEIQGYLAHEHSRLKNSKSNLGIKTTPDDRTLKDWKKKAKIV